MHVASLRRPVDVLKLFFICDIEFAKPTPNRLWVYVKPQRSFVLVRIGIGFHIFRKLFKINFTGVVLPCGFRRKGRIPTCQAGNTHCKTFGRLFKRQPFLLFDGKHVAAKFNRMGHPFNIINLNALGYIRLIAPVTKACRISFWPILLVCPSRVLPPVER